MNQTQSPDPSSKSPVSRDSNTRRIALLGSSGAMGREIERIAPEQGASILLRYDASHWLPENRPEIDVDVAIDFTLPDVVLSNIDRLLSWGIPVVVGTTGWLDSLAEVEQMVGERNGRLIWASNFSVGVQAFFRIARYASSLFNAIPHYDVALHEEHHRRKADSPSGTAKTLGEIILEEIERKRLILAETSHGRIDPEALHLSSSRVGASVGTHTVIFDADADTIDLTHRARNRGGFALGALLAADWILSAESGLYCFDDYFEEILHHRNTTSTL